MTFIHCLLYIRELPVWHLYDLDNPLSNTITQESTELKQIWSTASDCLDWNPDTIIISYVILGKRLNLSVLQLPYP